MAASSPARPTVPPSKYASLKRRYFDVVASRDDATAALYRAERQVLRLRNERNLLLDHINSIRQPAADINASYTLPPVPNPDLSGPNDPAGPRKRSKYLAEELEADPATAPSSLLKSRLKASPVAGDGGSTVDNVDDAVSYVGSDQDDDPAEPYFTETGEFIDPASQPAALIASKKKGGSNVSHPSEVSSAATSKLAPMATRPKRMKAHTVTRKTYTIPLIKRDESGNPILPLNCGIMTLYKLGHISTLPMFSTERYIFPIGYEVARTYNSMVNPNESTTYTCRILDGGDGSPRFEIEAADQPGMRILAGTATGAWSQVFKTANKIRERSHSNSVSGPDYYGLGQNTIKALLQELPGADQLPDYVMQDFVENSASRTVDRDPNDPDDYEPSSKKKKKKNTKQITANVAISNSARQQNPPPPQQGTQIPHYEPTPPGIASTAGGSEADHNATPYFDSSPASSHTSGFPSHTYHQQPAAYYPAPAAGYSSPGQVYHEHPAGSGHPPMGNPLAPSTVSYSPTPRSDGFSAMDPKMDISHS